MPGTGPLPRYSHQMAVHDGYLYVFGGNIPVVQGDELKDINQTNELWQYDLDGKEWTLLSESGPVARSDFVMQQHREELLIFGGLHYETQNDIDVPVDLQDLWSYNATSGKWTEVVLDIKPSTRYAHESSVVTCTSILTIKHHCV